MENKNDLLSMEREIERGRERERYFHQTNQSYENKSQLTLYSAAPSRCAYINGGYFDNDIPLGYFGIYTEIKIHKYTNKFRH